MGSAPTKEERASDIFTSAVGNLDINDLKDVDFGYENLSFEGGGAKGISYCGAIKVSCFCCYC